MVNVCGHTLCEGCVELLFLKGSGSCPECNVPLRRSNFRVQLFEDPAVEKEVDIRKRVLRDFNKKEEDFETADEYNNYLEEVEEIIFNLMNNVDIVNTNKRIEQYKRENRDIIQKNKFRLGREEMELEQLLENEKDQQAQRRKEILDLENEAKKKKTRDKEALIDELMTSYGDAKEIVTTFAKQAEETKIELEKKALPPPPQKTSHFSTGIQFSKGNQQLPILKLDEGPLYTYTSMVFETSGPVAPDLMAIQHDGFTKYIRPETVPERSGGFKTEISCQRAIQEAMQGLFHGCG
jgi:CDK-activating kinase assembly factor MAT1